MSRYLRIVQNMRRVFRGIAFVTSITLSLRTYVYVHYYAYERTFPLDIQFHFIARRWA